MTPALCTACARSAFIEGVFTGFVLALVIYGVFSWLARRP
jgi:tetrahydromethanopterin S-methyltransferase subunit F